MNIYSQRLHGFHTLRDGGETGVSDAWDEIGQREVVFKPCPTDSARDQKTAETVIRLSRQLGDSGFLGAEDVILEGSRIAGYTFPLIEYGNLLEIAGDLDDRELLGVLQTICQPLAYLHSLDYLHCDVKPDNIMVERTGDRVKPYVIDLGLAARRGAQHVTTIQGAPQFIAPEHRDGKPLSEAADVYSFGKLLAVLAPRLRSHEARGGLDTLSADFTIDDPSQRPQSFWDVYESLCRLHDRVFGPATREVLSPPLRDTGVRLRVNNLRQHIEGSERQWRGLCMVSGAAGVGKSKIVRELILERQFAGDETIRVTGVASLGELTELVNSRLSKQRGSGGRARQLWIMAETTSRCEFVPDDLLRLHSAVRGRQAVLLLEHRGPGISVPSDDIRAVRIKPFGLRECIIATSHLQNDPSVAPINGEALLIASAGNPWLLRECLRTRQASPRQVRRAEPVDFDRLNQPITDYWNSRLERLDPSQLAALEEASVFHGVFDPSWIAATGSVSADVAGSLNSLLRAGWLQRIDHNDQPARFQFVCRTARDFVRRRIGVRNLKSRAERLLAGPPQPDVSESFTPSSMWDLHRIAGRSDGAPSARDLWDSRNGLADTKLAALALLTEFRRLRRGGNGNLASLAARISETFSELGSVRRRKHWAAVAFNRLPTPIQGGDLTIADAHFLCHLYDLAGQPKHMLEALTAMLNDDGITDAHVKGYLLSELGTQYLYLSRWKEAGEYYMQAHHLLERGVPTSQEYVRNLNRVGLSLIRNGHFTVARKRFEQCRKLAQEYGYNHITRLSLGNLSILERDMGNPQAAMSYSRRVLQSYRSAGDAAGYLRALPDRVMCLVDLGEGYRAARTAQLAVWMANLHSDRVELRHAHNNLGWVLMMQGETGKAHEQLEAAVRVHAGAGDVRWTIRSKLNLAWVYLLAGELERATEYCESGLQKMVEMQAQDGEERDLHAECEARRILAQTAIMEEDLSAAERQLAQIPRDDARLSPRDQMDTALAWLSLSLWKGDLVRSERLIEDLANEPIVENVHPMRCDFGRMRGMLYTLQGNYDRALEVLTTTSSDCRRGGRIDKLIDTMIALVFLAQSMHNWAVGQRYLQTVTKLTETMKQQLKP